MLRARLALVALSGVATISSFASCVDPTDKVGTPPIDGGLGLEGSTSDGASPSVDASTEDAATNDAAKLDATASDASDASVAADGAGSDASAPYTCGAVTQLDAVGGVDGADIISAATGPGGTWAAMWFQTSATTGDGFFHAKARVFNGTTLLPEQDLGTTAFAIAAPIVVDPTGRAFTFQDANRRNIDLATGTLSAVSTASIAGGGLDRVALAPIRTAGGGALSLYRTGTAMVADRWDIGQAKWVATDLVGPSVAYGMRVVTNAAGKAGAIWYVSDGGSGTDLFVSTYNGANWTVAKKKNFTSATVNFSPALVANGDLVIAHVINDVLGVTKYQAVAGVFDAPVTVNASGTATSSPQLVVDDLDRTTVGYLRAGHAYARLDTGAGFGAERIFGTATSLRLKEGPASSVVALTYNVPSIFAARAAAGSASWSNRQLTGSAINNGEDVTRQADVAFDASGHAIVIAQSNSLDGGAGVVLTQVTCQ